MDKNDDERLLDIWEVNENNLDLQFMGLWSITPLDNFNTPKSGTVSTLTVVRSKIQGNNIVLYSYLPNKHNNTDIVMDGNVGIQSKISEKVLMKDNKGLIGMIFIYALTPNDVISKRQTYKNGYIIDTEGEIDDIVYSANGEYKFKVTYYIENCKTSVLKGIRVVIPIEKFNHYVKMRDLYYMEYIGAKAIIN